MDRHRIFKHDGRWYLVRRQFGFSPHLSVSTYPSQKVAIFAAGGTTASSGSTERTYTPGYASFSYLRSNNFPMRIS